MLLELGNGGHVCSPPHSEPIPGPCREVKKTVCQTAKKREILIKEKEDEEDIEGEKNPRVGDRTKQKSNRN